MSATGLLALRAQDGATVTLERYPILLGRRTPGGTIPDVDVSHLDPNEAVDNRHLELIRVPVGVEVHDLGGISGSWVDGRRLAPGARALLEVGGSLRVAGVVMTLIAVAGTPPPPPSGRSRASSGSSATWLENGPAQGIPPPDPDLRLRRSPDNVGPSWGSRSLRGRSPRRWELSAGTWTSPMRRSAERATSATSPSSFCCRH